MSSRSPSRTPTDRKSTRLNSSHLGISYAVFCLKKYVALSPEDASSFGKEVELFGQRLPVKIVMGVQRGQAGVPAGVPPFAGLDLPFFKRTAAFPYQPSCPALIPSD